MARLVSKTTYDRTLSQGISFSDLDDSEIITKEILMQVLGINDPGNLGRNETYTFTISGTATSTGNVTLMTTSGAQTVIGYNTGDTADKILSTLVATLSSSLDIYNLNYTAGQLEIVQKSTTPDSATQYQVIASNTVDGLTYALTISTFVPEDAAYFNSTDRKIVE